MRKMRSILLFGFALLLLSATAWAEVASNTVPTNRLAATFGVVKFPPWTQAHVYAYLLARPAPGADPNQGVLLSSDEHVYISSQGVQTEYDGSPGATTVIPYSPGATYQVTFVRANGETYAAQTTIPEAVAISTPAQNAVFDKSEAVEVHWNSVVSQDNYAAAGYSGCDYYQGVLDLQTTYAKVPANFASSCPAQVYMSIKATYMNWSNFSGLDGGIWAESSDDVDFSFAGSPSAATSVSTEEFRLPDPKKVFERLVR